VVTAVEKLYKRGEEAAKDFRSFCRFVGGVDPAPHQEDWVEACQNIGDNPLGNQKYIVVAPPGSGKSQMIAVWFAAWIIGRYPESHTGLLSYANKPAWDRSKAIRDIIVNEPAYHYTFPKIKKDPSSWGASGFRVRRPRKDDPMPTLLAGGTRSAVVSYRLGGLILDDAIDQKQAANSDQRLKAWENYEKAIMTRLIDNSWQMCIGTRWSADDFISELLKRKAEGWKLIHVPALDMPERKHSYWQPDGHGNGYSDEFMEIKEKLDPELFQVQYMGDPSAEAIGIIKKLLTYKEVPDLELVRTMDLLVGVGWDTAYKDKEKNDPSVGYVGGLDPYGRIWLLDRRMDRFTTPKLIKEIEDVQDFWDPYCQWIEDTSGGTPAVQMIVQETPDIPVETVLPSQGGKRSRAHALAPFIHSGRILFPRYVEWFEEAKYYITRFPFLSNDDDIDALWTLVSQLFQITHPAEYEHRNRARLEMG
jgi:predicted phage terminase large subunit-like protein